MAVVAGGAGVWFARGDEEPAEAKRPVLADLTTTEPLTLAHFTDGQLYADGEAIPYDGPEGKVVDAGSAILLRTSDGRVVRINKAGGVTEIGSGASEVPVVDGTGRYAAWPLSPDSKSPTHTGVMVWDLDDARKVGQPAFPFPPGPDGPAPIALDHSGRVYITDPKGQLLGWDPERNTYVVSGVSKVDSVAGGDAGLVIRSGDTTTNYPNPEAPGLGDGQSIRSTHVAWSRTDTVAWFDGSDDVQVASDGSRGGDPIGWPADVGRGRIVWERGEAFVVLPASPKDPVIRCDVGDGNCSLVAKDS